MTDGELRRVEGLDGERGGRNSGACSYKRMDTVSGWSQSSKRKRSGAKLTLKMGERSESSRS